MFGERYLRMISFSCIKYNWSNRCQFTCVLDANKYQPTRSPMSSNPSRLDIILHIEDIRVTMEFIDIIM